MPDFCNVYREAVTDVALGLSFYLLLPVPLAKMVMRMLFRSLE